MRKIILFAIAVLLVSCSENKVEKALENYVIERAGGFADGGKLDYKLISYVITDTLTNAELLDSLKHELDDAFVWEDPTKDSLLSYKSTKFPDSFLKNDEANKRLTSLYASLDSLANVWDKVTPYSYELNYLPNQIRLIHMVVYDIEPSSDFERHFNNMVEKEKIYRQADSLFHEKPNEIYAYKVNHEYSFFNIMLNKTINISNIVFLDKDLKVISVHLQNDFADMLKQLSK